MPTAAEQRAQAAQRQAEDVARMATLYGSHRGDVHLLRRRGYVVTKEAGGFQVDNKTIDSETLKALADRERRLEGNMETATNGHVPSAVIAANCKCGKEARHRGNCWARRGLDGPPEKSRGARKTKPRARHVGRRR